QVVGKVFGQSRFDRPPACVLDVIADPHLLCDDSVGVDGENAISGTRITILWSPDAACIHKIDAIDSTVIGNVGVSEADNIGFGVKSSPLCVLSQITVGPIDEKIFAVAAR